MGEAKREKAKIEEKITMTEEVPKVAGKEAVEIIRDVDVVAEEIPEHGAKGVPASED